MRNIRIRHSKLENLCRTDNPDTSAHLLLELPTPALDAVLERRLLAALVERTPALEVARIHVPAPEVAADSSVCHFHPDLSAP